MDTDEFIADTMKRVAAAAAPPSREAPEPTRTRTWHAPLTVAAVAAAVVLIVAAASLVASHRSKETPPSSRPGTTACHDTYSPRPLPSWARAGFNPPDQPVPYVLSDHGDMAAILWATRDPLVAPPAPSKNNKILWVAKVGAYDGPFRIRATLASTGQTVSRTLAAAGPSTIDLPRPGCWSLDLTWGTHEDHLSLGYAPR